MGMEATWGLADPSHDIYKWQNEHRSPGRLNRSASFSHADRSAIVDPAAAQMKEPGGFRRNYLSARAQERGVEEPQMIRNVIDFLFIYGHFVSTVLQKLTPRLVKI